MGKNVELSPFLLRLLAPSNQLNAVSTARHANRAELADKDNYIKPS